MVSIIEVWCFFGLFFGSGHGGTRVNEGLFSFPNMVLYFVNSRWDSPNDSSPCLAGCSNFFQKWKVLFSTKRSLEVFLWYSPALPWRCQGHDSEALRVINPQEVYSLNRGHVAQISQKVPGFQNPVLGTHKHIYVFGAYTFPESYSTCHIKCDAL